MAMKVTITRERPEGTDPSERREFRPGIPASTGGGAATAPDFPDRPLPDRPPAIHPLQAPPGEALVALTAPESFEADRYRVLRHRLENSRDLGKPRVIAVTSACAGDGKTTTAINLALTLASSGDRKVLLADADMRLSNVATQLGMGDTRLPGLADLLLDSSLQLEGLVRRRPPARAAFLTAGRVLESPCDALRSARLEEIVEEARRAFDFVVIDTPPVGPVPDCQAISRVVDGVLVVVAAHRTPRRALEEALNALDPGKVTGLILNGGDVPNTEYYGRYYHRRR
ncbi:MAG TPA: CpsD/CapB family tyrosine-protein kinase [Verrucomicrobiae bacterium]|nr:CpsD/CapB family tyrosine-protein kinase [Verrucomicrobiae bacterium]